MHCMKLFAELPGCRSALAITFFTTANSVWGLSWYSSNFQMSDFMQLSFKCSKPQVAVQLCFIVSPQLESALTKDSFDQLSRCVSEGKSHIIVLVLLFLHEPAHVLFCGGCCSLKAEGVCACGLPSLMCRHAVFLRSGLNACSAHMRFIKGMFLLVGCAVTCCYFPWRNRSLSEALSRLTRPCPP